MRPVRCLYVVQRMRPVRCLYVVLRMRPVRCLYVVLRMRPVRCLYDRARNITKEASNLEAEKAHLSGALKWNGYPGAFIRAASQKSKPRERDPEEAQGQGNPTLMMLPYVAGVSERIRKACRNYNIRVVF